MNASGVELFQVCQVAIDDVLIHYVLYDPDPQNKVKNKVMNEYFMNE